jgi:hypothetical protein
MVVSFVRSGGLSGIPGLRVRASATFDEHTGRVTAENYARELAPAEARDLVSIVETIAASNLSPVPAPGTRDAFTYDFSIAVEDGRNIRAAASDGTEMPPAWVRLVQWASHESGAITRARVR